MAPQLLSIHYSDPLWIAIAFLCGLAVKAIRLPPLVGFLLAGYLLSALGAEGGQFLGAMADLGITLLLFSIGLKLKLKSLARPEVWGVATLHMAIVTGLYSLFIVLLSYTTLPLVSGISRETAVMIAFALSFSSTVFAVKVLDEMGAMNARHGQTAVGVLVIQDIAAVIFIAVSLAKLPSLWACSLILLFPLRVILWKVMNRVGHGELLILFGITLALIGADLFELLGIKEDVGALVFGMLLANHPRANEMTKALLGFKELFLVGFFLTIGMTAVPDIFELFIALLFVFVLPVKVALYFGLFSLFCLRTSTAWRTSLNLANYSEFGLIVSAIAVSSGLLSHQWLSVLAMALSLSFLASAPIINARDPLYRKWRHRLKIFERKRRLAGEENLELAHVRAVVFGMGRTGVAAYNTLNRSYAGYVVGVELDREKAKKLNAAGRSVVNGDATNPDFWLRAPELHHGLEWVLLTLPKHKANINAVMRLRELGYQGRIAVTTRYQDEEQELKALGVDHTFNIYSEAGLGFANELQIVVRK
ncbi:cation:proton antiporter family protein [Vibrio sp. SCSIO 43137]|uniref:cation:proton antiporter family protein n=1 Tax=Vibrio sp. SCSIO 43137 TaxID=3021011 RepID=UPI0023076432|nr:cation:proton antiporter family protein [Vibrio sp. SCSIO 43137]WCE31541.1 cation:proton antiporter [Vibrio sp. SCSIO 43137]